MFRFLFQCQNLWSPMIVLNRRKNHQTFTLLSEKDEQLESAFSLIEMYSLWWGYYVQWDEMGRFTYKHKYVTYSASLTFFLSLLRQKAKQDVCQNDVFQESQSAASVWNNMRERKWWQFVFFLNLLFNGAIRHEGRNRIHPNLQHICKAL